MDTFEERLNQLQTLTAFIGIRFFVLTIVAMVVVSFAAGAGSEELQPIGTIIIVGLVITALEWVIFQRIGVEDAMALPMMRAVHSTLLIAILIVLLNQPPLQESWLAVLFLLPVVEGGLLYGVVGSVVVSAISVGAAWFYSASIAAANTSLLTLLEQVRFSALFAPTTLSLFVTPSLVLTAGAMIAATGSYVQRQTKQQFALISERSEALLIELDEGVVIYNNESIIEYLNPAAETLLGASRRDVVGRSIGKLSAIAVPGSQNLSAVLYAPLDDHQSRPISLIDSDRMVRVTQRSLFNHRGEPMGLVRLIRDVTDQQRVGTLKSEFVSVAAHNLRTPLSGIRWALNELSEDETLPQQHRVAVAEAEEAAERMITLIADMLDVARIEEGRFDYAMQEAHLDTVLNDVVTMTRSSAQEKGIQLDYTPPDTATPLLQMDAQKMRVVLETLLDNAVKYTPVDGAVAVRLEQREAEVLLTVRDTGVGIPAGQHDRVFSKFFRGDNVIRMQTDGTGLGLYIARNIVERHNGRIWFESNEGKGTTFYVALPIAAS